MSRIVDCHFHLDESVVSLDGLVASMDAAGVERVALIPPLCPPITLTALAPLVLPVFRRAIHGRGLLHRAALAMYGKCVKSDGTVDLLGRRFAVVAQPPNDPVVAAVDRRPDRFSGFVFVNPAGPADPMREIDRCMRGPGMVGVKAHPFWHAYPVSRLLDVARRCEREGWPMLVHLGAGASGDWRLLPESFPRLRIVYAHAGIPYSREITRFARDSQNVFVDLSSTPYVDERAATQAIRVAGAERCLFGTDGPYLYSRADRFEFRPFIERLGRLGLTAAERERVAGGSFRGIVGLG